MDSSIDNAEGGDSPIALHQVEFLEYLTADDRQQIIRNAEVRHYGKGDRILEEGSSRQVLGVVLSGGITINRHHLGNQIVMATSKAGDVFGEMSFLDGATVSASIFARDDGTQILMLNLKQLKSLLQSVPGLATRFYQSLAELLTKRLRETQATYLTFLVEEVAQVQRTGVPHTLRSGQNALPQSIINSVEAFKTAMAEAGYLLTKGKQTPEVVQPTISVACQRMIDDLQTNITNEAGLSEAIGAYVFRETFPFFMASRSIDRAYTKPRGYAGDATTISMIYDHLPEGDGRLGLLVDVWVHTIPSVAAVRNRRKTVVGYIEENLKNWNQPESMPVTSLACGPAREVFDIFSKNPAAAIEVQCVDIDPEALHSVGKQSSMHKLGDKVRLVQGNIIRMALGKGGVSIPPQAMMYSIGLMDYLQDNTVVTVLNWIHDTLLPDGEVIIGNFNTSNPDKAFMDHISEWILIHRSPAQLERLFADSKFSGSKVTVEEDATGVQLFARCRKPAALQPAA